MLGSPGVCSTIASVERCTFSYREVGPCDAKARLEEDADYFLMCVCYCRMTTTKLPFKRDELYTGKSRPTAAAIAAAGIVLEKFKVRLFPPNFGLFWCFFGVLGRFFEPLAKFCHI